MFHTIAESLEENWQVVSDLNKKEYLDFSRKKENKKILNFGSSWKG